MTEAAKKEENTPAQPPEAEAREAEQAPEAAAPQANPMIEKMKQLAEEVARLKDAYLRAMAETENVRTRAKRDMEDAAKYAATKFARDMVNIIENLQRASGSIPAEARAGSEVLKQVGDGLDMTMQELLNIFERNGIKRVNPAGQKFDHNLHQAVAQIPTKDVPAGNVVQVLQAGYVLHDRLLKPAMVTVAVASENKPAADGGA